MIRTTLTAVAFIAMTASAFADPMSSTTPNNGSMTNGSMSSGAMSSDSMSMDSMSCQQMMDKGQPMYDGMMAGDKKTMAMNDMNMAKKSMAAKHEANCKMHMKKAMMDMK